ncbi:MAG: hypothetical protein KDC90_17875 [Ignavibacteriae bacterium]|nr:hypothetical protein [Ignavibacteriota bacterium]
MKWAAVDPGDIAPIALTLALPFQTIWTYPITSTEQPLNSTLTLRGNFSFESAAGAGGESLYLSITMGAQPPVIINIPNQTIADASNYVEFEFIIDTAAATPGKVTRYIAWKCSNPVTGVTTENSTTQAALVDAEVPPYTLTLAADTSNSDITLTFNTLRGITVYNPA